MGALGPVFRTYEPTRDRLVAIKVFRLDVTPEQAQSLADELLSAADAGLFHPSIVEPIAAGVEGTVAYRAEEYVAAETLDVALRHYAPAPIDKVLLLITQLAGAIDFARTAGVGHGALHPRDIFVTPEEARATGFGVVEALERVGLRAPVRRPYSAPERVSGGAWGTPADVFSLAAIAYELLTGRRPAGTGSQVGTVSGTTAGHHPGALHAVFVQAMDADPTRRFQTALGFASALDAASRGEAPLTTYERGAAGAAAIAAPLAAGPPPSPPVPSSPISYADVEPEATDDHPAAHVDHAEPTGRLHYEAADAAIPVERSLFAEEPLGDLGLDAPTAIETERFADEFSVAAADLRSESREARAFDDIQDIEEDDNTAVVDDDHAAYVAPTSAAAGSTLFGQGSVEDRPARGYAPPSVDSGYADRSSTEDVRHDRPRRSAVPIALVALVFGLLLGAAGVYALLSRGEGEPAADSQQAASKPADAPTGEAAKPFSEGTVGSTKPEPPKAESSAPPVINEERRTEKPAPPSASAKEPPAAKTGRVVVSSSPSRAAVTVNGRWRGRTPLTLDDLPFGALEVRVVQPGYTAQTERVTLSSATPSRTLSFKLQRAAAAASRPAPRRDPPRSENAKPESFTGSIYVDSRPRGARVLLDGKVVGTTPMRIPDVRIGSHIIRLQLDDHSDWTSSARVVSGQESRVTGSLERIR